jgi:L-asparaginase
MAIKLFITGGTIDCVFYNPETDDYQFNDTYIPKMLKQSRITLPIKTKKLMLKDSRDIKREDRELILKKCLECEEDKILITHGTFTMPETAKFLGNRIKNKTIVLLGSAIPFNENNSDALFNLGSAITAVQTLPKGVYITMNGKIFSWNNVRKNKKLGNFEELKPRNAPDGNFGV